MLVLVLILAKPLTRKDQAAARPLLGNGLQTTPVCFAVRRAADLRHDFPRQKARVFCCVDFGRSVGMSGPGIPPWR